jgi:hypothetical protein
MSRGNSNGGASEIRVERVDRIEVVTVNGAVVPASGMAGNGRDSPAMAATVPADRDVNELAEDFIRRTRAALRGVGGAGR